MSKSRMAAFLAGSVRMASVAVAVALVMSAASSTAFAVDLPVPEIDPGSAGSALTLLTGGVLILRDRIRRK